MAEEIKINNGGSKEPIGKTVAILVTIFAGSLGIHRLLMGYSNWWLQLITLGGCGIWTIIDLIHIIQNQMPMADGTPLKDE